MQWDDVGFLISKNKYGENGIISEFYTLNHGKCTGIVYGGTSKKIKNYLQLGNKLFLSYKTKNENRVGYFKVEIINPIAPFFFDNKEKILILISAINILRSVTPELQKNEKIYNLFSILLDNLKLKNENNIIEYIYWEIDLLKIIGYDLNLDQNNVISKNGLCKITLDNQNYTVPNFLIDRNLNNIENKFIIFALKFVGNYIDQKILRPNNLLFPIYRQNLEKLYS